MLFFRVGSSPDPSQDLAELIIIFLSVMYQNNCALLLDKKLKTKKKQKNPEGKYTEPWAEG